MNKFLFSIITITYNDLENLKLTIQNVINQESNSFKFEYIIIDGASSDGSIEYLQDYTNSIDIIVSESDNGIYDAMNKGIERANGRYLIFMNAGDVFYSSETLTTIHNFMKENSFPDFIYGDSIEIAEHSDTEIYKKSRDHTYIWYGLFIQHQSMIYKRDIIEQNSILYRILYTVSSDYAFTYEVLSNSKSIKYMAVPICKFKLGGASSILHKTGLEDQNRIRKDVMNYSLPKRLWISFLHRVMLFNREYMPKIYKIIHSRS